ncbi:MAG: PilW family protein [Gammaproteobacteria bacterium]|nr:PilW family protein [Gammaproteobacteria bacterium]
MKDVKKNLGSSLIELMVAVTLSLFVLAGVADLYLASKNNFKRGRDVAKVQENERLIYFILSQAIQMAGYSGCISGRLQDGIRGFNENNLPAFLQNKKIIKGSDVLVVKSANFDIANLLESAKSGDKTIYVKNNPASKNYPWVFLSNCHYKDQVQANGFFKNKIVLINALKHSYAKDDAEIGGIRETAFFIAKNGRKSGESLYKLIKSVGISNKQELLENIKNMYIWYGIDLNADHKVDSYLPCNQVENWDNVLLVKLEIDLAMQKKLLMYVKLRERQ